MRHCKTTYFTDQKKVGNTLSIFILGLKFIFLHFEFTTIHYHTPQKRTIEFKKRIKLNHIIKFGPIFYELGFSYLTRQIFGLLLLIFTEIQPKISKFYSYKSPQVIPKYTNIYTPSRFILLQLLIITGPLLIQRRVESRYWFRDK